MEIVNKNILITGGVGFIGSHLVKALTDQGIFPIVLYRSIDLKSYFTLQNLNTKTQLIYQDINDYAGVYRIITKYKINVVFHLAAQALVELAYDNPLDTLLTNIIGTANILEVCRQKGDMDAIIVASSDKAYGKKGNVKYKESDALVGNHPYETSKASADLIAQMYIKTYNMPISITRFGNVYGEGDLNFSRIIPGIMQALIKKQTLDVRSNGKFIRDYIYVDDVVNGYLSIIKNWNKICGQSINFGSKETLSVMEIVQLVEKTLKLKIKHRILNNSKNEINYQSLNDNKARKILKWRHNYNLKNMLPEIYSWYKNSLTQ
ncbi:MAG: hypothetical protein UR52_C0001G0034 [Candidatus Gottesmanbacteria bacterium GW2011_GWA1_34_13]|uniref:NAD(P)-binding domain-containing protein n=1 Tax=Candidatus Gottesmanbacteria bacterium GW2011_GWA1_34_13 TaxID=1618434 RepID=A0A0G0ASQ6_9BACT|nr:MAG: hypothetical protein UR52_C0001G0034 [Candidatus Gottesmanbacteria bacterium GW2011_GWA1_34_13]